MYSKFLILTKKLISLCLVGKTKPIHNESYRFDAYNVKVISMVYIIKQQINVVTSQLRLYCNCTKLILFIIYFLI